MKDLPKPPPPHATARLTVDLSALRANYRALNTLVGAVECAGVVKADAYGLGLEEVVGALTAEGCRTLFVATLDEAYRARSLSREAMIYVLGGLLPQSARGFQELNVRPVLASLVEIEDWAAYCLGADARLPAAIQVDTGMSRLGLPPAEVERLVAAPDILQRFELALVMSHLACGDEPGHDKNRAQRQAFDALRARLPAVRASFANSAGTLLGEPYHYDLVRPGIAIYGGAPLAGVANPMKPVVRLEARIHQVRELSEGATIGYGATFKTVRPTRIATLGLGYADGYLRALSSKGQEPGPVAIIGPHRAPIVGRVSMDLITIDVTDVPPELAQRGAWAELIGSASTPDELAQRAGTISYELLTRLGRRALRVYVNP